ncbi:PHP domain protein [Phycisphaerae bacterium RAS1]|nr:PHP domain protein [Phycisphaerae bacterium RAS1]
MTRPLVCNLHNHTPFSDGAYTIDELCEAHRALRDVTVESLGICDHLFCTPSSREVKNEREFERVFVAEARAYVREVLAARGRWAGKMTIYCGVELNWPMNRGFLDLIKTHLEGVDYVLFEYVDWAGLTQLANQVRRWPCPVGLAHAAVEKQFPATSHDQIVRTLANARIFYEINSKFLPLADGDPWYTTLPGHRVPISLGTDTHDDLSCLNDLAVMHDFAQRHGLGGKFFVPTIRQQAALSA